MTPSRKEEGLREPSGPPFLTPPLTPRSPFPHGRESITSRSEHPQERRRWVHRVVESSHSTGRDPGAVRPANAAKRACRAVPRLLSSARTLGKRKRVGGPPSRGWASMYLGQDRAGAESTPARCMRRASVHRDGGPRTGCCSHEVPDDTPVTGPRKGHVRIQEARYARPTWRATSP